MNIFFQVLKRKKISGILLSNSSLNNQDPNINYFTGLTLEYCFLFISRKKKILFVPEMEYERAKKKSKIRRVSVISKDKKKFLNQLKKIIKGKNIGINADSLTINQLKGLKKLRKRFVDVSGNLKKIRMKKTKEEIKIIKTACNITAQIMNKLIRNIKKFKSEKEISVFLEEEALKHNCKTSFKSIVASGPNSSKPHAEPENKLYDGFMVVDFGVRYRGYCSDVTRTFYKGKPNDEEIALYSLVYMAQQKAINSCKVNVTSRKVYNVAFKALKKYSKYFIHGLGHGIGVEIHENPNLNLKSKDKLSINTVFTVEPGIYIPGKFGIRIEDDILMTKKGPVVLTSDIPKNLICF
ncbi:MAG: Xaa-Pro peptidase family protein [Candidatus Woesearchaeota archaeon]